MVAMALTVSAMMVMMMNRSVLTVGCWGGEGGKGGRGGECGRGGGCSGRGDRFVGVLQVVEEDLVSWRSRACLWCHSEVLVMLMAIAASTKKVDVRHGDGDGKDRAWLGRWWGRCDDHDTEVAMAVTWR